jgi:hypothetical protein
MSYRTQDEIASNNAMQRRLAQGYAGQQQVADPDRWAYDHRRYWAAAPGWDAAWESALASHSGDPAYDPGEDEAVITDGMILSQIQSMLPPMGP